MVENNDVKDVRPVGDKVKQDPNKKEDKSLEVAEMLNESYDDTYYFDFSNSCDYKAKSEESLSHHIALYHIMQYKT